MFTHISRLTEVQVQEIADRLIDEPRIRTNTCAPGYPISRAIPAQSWYAPNKKGPWVYAAREYSIDDFLRQGLRLVYYICRRLDDTYILVEYTIA